MYHKHWILYLKGCIHCGMEIYGGQQYLILPPAIFYKLSSSVVGFFYLTVLIFSSFGRRPASLCHGPLSVMQAPVRASVCVLTFSLNVFFSETTCRILMKFHRNVPAVVLFRILVAMATKHINF